MSKNKINRNISERSLLTEVIPYETPLLFSNWGSFNFLHNLQEQKTPTYLNDLLSTNKPSVPYKYKIKKNDTSFRTLSLVHPKHSEEITDFYDKFDVLILKACSKSKFSIREPKEIAKYFTKDDARENNIKYVEELEADQAYASSYFSYDRYSHLYKFFESDFFTQLEKKFSKIKYFDISKCFPSIYTHSISWAFRSKRNAKRKLHDTPDNSFDKRFDNLMSNFNYNETNGIVVGPEISRIFAEIILQEIDSVILKKMQKEGLKLGDDYWCCRYVDDYFMFFNHDSVNDQFIRYLSHELEKYKLYLNDQKTETIERPFITDASIKKIEISNYFRELKKELQKAKYIPFSREINKIRSVLKSKNVNISTLSNFYLGCLQRSLKDINDVDKKDFVDKASLLIEIAFHLFRMDVRVSTTFKITDIILETLKKSNDLTNSYSRKLKDKIYVEVNEALEYSLQEGGSLECLNLMIIIPELGKEYNLQVEHVNKLITKCKREHDDEYSRTDRLSYFEICSLLYLFGNKKKFEDHKDDVIETSFFIIKNYSPEKYSESAYLLLDLLSCPYIGDDTKNVLIKLALSHNKRKTTKQLIGTIRNFVSKYNWYMNWNEIDDLKSLLKKKQYLQAY